MVKKKIILIVFTNLFFLGFFLQPANSQHRGDNLAFQGIDNINSSGVKALAMGGSYTSISGQLDALFWNPAGLVGIKGFQLSFNTNSSNMLWRERQDYRPNRQLVTMSFILDGLYTPNPQYNGQYDYEAFLNDSTYHVKDPELGLDSYSEEAADWQKEMNNSGINSFAAAFPFRMFNKPVVISAGLNRHYLAMNYDRNQTYLDPHPAFDGYGPIPERVTSSEDSVRINWYDFQRERSGPLSMFFAAVGFGFTENIQLGFGVNRLTGESSDYQRSNKIGYFDLVEGYNVFKFSYDTLDVITTGKSKFSATNINLGTILKFNHFSVGVKVVLPYTIKREWNYNTSYFVSDTTKQQSELSGGTDEMKVPFSFNFGLSVKPRDNFTIAFDYEKKPYSNSEFTLANGDSTHRKWLDQNIFRIGIEYQPIQRISLLAGYRNIPAIFAPDGAAFQDRGPVSDSYTFGISVTALFGRFDLAYEIRRLKYYDVYYSNTNYSYKEFDNLLFGYTLMF